MRIYNRDPSTGRINKGHTQLTKEQRDEKFWSFVGIKSKDGCWEWVGSKDEKGYGRFHIGKHKYSKAHRYSLSLAEHLKEELVVDHMCMNKGCVNPNHLRQVSKTVSSLENTRCMGALNKVKTHCKWGHEFNKENTYITNKSTRVCKTCLRLKYHSNRNRDISQNA